MGIHSTVVGNSCNLSDMPVEISAPSHLSTAVFQRWSPVCFDLCFLPLARSSFAVTARPRPPLWLLSSTMLAYGPSNLLPAIFGFAFALLPPCLLHKPPTQYSEVSLPKHKLLYGELVLLSLAITASMWTRHMDCICLNKMSEQLAIILCFLKCSILSMPQMHAANSFQNTQWDENIMFAFNYACMLWFNSLSGLDKDLSQDSKKGKKQQALPCRQTIPRAKEGLFQKCSKMQFLEVIGRWEKGDTKHTPPIRRHFSLLAFWRLLKSRIFVGELLISFILLSLLVWLLLLQPRCLRVAFLFYCLDVV